MDHEEGKFVYCIIERNLESANPASLELSFPLNGIDGRGLETISYEDLTAVVSNVNVESFNDMEKEHLNKCTEVYQWVNIALMENHTVVPIRFGTIARNRGDVEDILGKVYLQIKTALMRLRDKVELVVQASWNLTKVLQEIRNDRNIQEVLKGATQEANPQGSLKKIEIGRMLFEVAEVRRNGFIEAIHRELTPFAIDFSDGPCKGEDMIINRSYLVKKEKGSLFDETMNRLGTEHEGLLTFRYIGPLPAYSFTNIEFTQGDFQVIDRARKVLELPERASFEIIKASFRRLSLQYHPDRNPGDPKAEERFKEIVSAYEILSTYCQSCRNLPGEQEALLYSFAEDDVENIFIVKNKGALQKRIRL